ncbi:MAG: hypothetical protein JSW58_14035 [Candidatus Latescibacterota bacterium]|nr:MAG: hypothetical protein JSW58_14035 [Candidatus Latescibacterota bacterium]
MPRHYAKVLVECYSGYRGDEEPRWFYRDDRKLEVTSIIDRWVDPRHRYFKVCGSDEGTYVLRQDVRLGSWELSVLTRPHGP